MARAKLSDDVTIHDVAREAHVSVATVSRVINNKGYISPDTRDRVMRAVTRLGYVVNQQARSLAGGQSHIIGLVVREVGSAFIGGIMRGVDAEIDAAGYDLMLYTTHLRKTKEATFVATLTRGLADGLLLVLPHEAGAYLATLRRHRFPYVVVDYHKSGEAFSTVGVTNYQGGYDATTYLVELGHQRIAFITGLAGTGSARDRLAGYRAALKAHGIREDPDLVVEGDFTEMRGYAAATRLLDLPQPPTAIFAANDESAFGVIDAARDRGLRIPDDLSIIGFDDAPRSAIISPSLTTVRQPLEDMGRIATQMLLRAVADPDDPPASVVLPTELIVRHSCARRASKATE